MTNIELPLSLREAEKIISHHAGDFENDEALATLVATARDLSNAAVQISDGVTKIRANPMATSLKNARDARDFAWRLFDKIMPRVDKATGYTQKLIAELDKNTQPQAPRDAVTAVAAGQIQQLLRGMTPTERMAALNEVIDDDAFVGAALTANRLLTGLTDAEKAVMTEKWRRHRHPKTVERIARLSKVNEELGKLGSLCLSWLSKLTAESDAELKLAEESERKAREALESAAA